MNEFELKKPEWSFQEGEDASSYERFVIYRDAGPGRSYNDIALALDKVDDDGRPLRSFTSSLSAQAKKYRWEERIAAFIEDQQQRMHEAELQEKINRKKKALKRLDTLEDSVLKPLEFYINRINSGQIRFDTLDSKSFYDVLCQMTRAFALIQDTRAKLTGDPTEIFEHQGEVSSKIEIEIKHSKYESEDTGD